MRPPQKMERPHMHPGTCAQCSCAEQANRQYFVDTGISYDYEGNVYLCDACLRDIIKVSGEYYHRDELNEMLSIQTNMIDNANTILVDWKELKDWALAHAGIDLDYMKTTMKAEAKSERADRVLTGSSTKANGTDGQAFSISRIMGD